MTWENADEMSDRIIDLLNARLNAGVDPVSLYAGQLLGFVGFLRTAPQPAPDSLTEVAEAAVAALRDLANAYGEPKREAKH